MPSKIEWTGETWNPIAGCSIVSPGCTNCYAMRMAARIERMSPGLEHYRGLTKPSKAGPVWTGKVALAPERTLLEPLRRRKPTTYFVNSMSDLFHEDVPEEWIDRVFAVMALCPQHTFQVLTKRSGRMRSYVSDNIIALRERIDAAARAVGFTTRFMHSCLHDWPLPNVWLGVSAERQPEADARIPDLLATPAAVRFVSAEPLLGPVDFTRARTPSGDQINVLRHVARGVGHDGSITIGGRTTRMGPVEVEIGQPSLDWIIVGGESGPGARPMSIEWARDIVRQCKSAGVSVFMKQLGSEPREGTNPSQWGRYFGSTGKGGEPAEWPDDLRIREMPGSAGKAVF